jgi:UDP-GlcNAc3NAcA epimerase
MRSPLRLLTIVGARPQIIKAAALSRAIAGPFAGRISETILHTGQHYDAAMSQVFFEELGIPEPGIRLEVGSASHGIQTARMLEGLEAAMLRDRPDVVVVYGDTNSTLAGAVAASKLHIPIAHIEAGLRSFNKAMPEEINRIVSDHCSTWLFCPTRTAVENLVREGFSTERAAAPTMDKPHVIACGDVMYDNSLHYARLAQERSTLLNDLGIGTEPFLLATLHRPSNTDDPQRLQDLLQVLADLAETHRHRIVLPLHPRTLARLGTHSDGAALRQLQARKGFHLIPPVGFLDMIALERNAALVLTDSGGVQKEAYFFGRPCVILREETEWVELVQEGMATLAGADPQRIAEATAHFLGNPATHTEGLFGDGRAAEHICSELLAGTDA